MCQRWGRCRGVLGTVGDFFRPDRLDLFWIDYPGLRSRGVAGPGLLAFTRSGLRFGSLIEEQFPFGDAVGVAEVGRDRQFLRRARNGDQLAAGLVREAVGLALVHFLRGPDEVFPRVHAAARAGHDVVEAAFVRTARHDGGTARGIIPFAL